MDSTRRPEMRSSTRGVLGNATTRLMSRSLLFYLLVLLAHKVWMLLNSDVALLLRRAH